MSTEVMKNAVYLLCFRNAEGEKFLLGSDKHQAGHYMGYADDVEKRISEHRSGDKRAARINSAVVRNGGALKLVRTWSGDRVLERKLKKAGNFRSLCPLCKEEYRCQNNERQRRRHAKKLLARSEQSSED